MKPSISIYLNELAAALKQSLPDGYRNFVEKGVENTVIARGFDPKTLLVLNLELRESLGDVCKGKFFLNGDGCGNFYFLDLSPEAQSVFLWSHDPPGIEDTLKTLDDYLETAIQVSRIDWPIQPGTSYLCRTVCPWESILEPIYLSEWLAVVESTDGIEHVGFQELQNPFTSKTIRINCPGFVRVPTDSREYFLQLRCGRVSFENVPALRTVVKILARKLAARLVPEATPSG